MEATEAEIVAECCDELELLMKEGGRSSERKRSSGTRVNLLGSVTKRSLSPDEILDGETLVANLRDVSKRVTDGRKTHFDPSASVASPRFFLLPATDEKGEIQNSCSQYRLFVLFDVKA